MEKPFKKLRTPFRCYSCVPSLKISRRPQGVGFVTNRFKLRQIYSPGGSRHMCEARCPVYCSLLWNHEVKNGFLLPSFKGLYCLLNRNVQIKVELLSNSICNCNFDRDVRRGCSVASIVTQTSVKGSLVCEISFFPRDSNLVQLQFVSSLETNHYRGGGTC